MAAHSNRSPSPLSSRSSNPNPRNSENNSTARRSFSGNNPFGKPSILTNSRRFDPITPANSPSDFARRSVSKDGEKENDERDHNLKTSKLQSPAKGCKNFMSPTISAASKFTPSPRKKVLVERNDPVRTSISLSDGKALFLSTNVSQDLDSKSDPMEKTENSLDAVEEDHPVSKPPKRVTFSDIPSDSHNTNDLLSESVIAADSTDYDSSLKNKVSCSSISPSIAPLDADPSLPPYDPKMNYLSPRPQFLHYKPNPRIGILLNKDKGLESDESNRLEDSFMAEIMSEDFSDSEGTEESQTESSPKKEMAVDMVIGLEDMEDDFHISESSEPLPVIATVTNNSISEENTVQKTVKKARTFSRLICFSMLMMFLIACVSNYAVHSPSLDELVHKDWRLPDLSIFYQQSRVAASAKVNFDRLARHVNQFSVNSMSLISKLSNELSKGEELAPLQFMNLSDLQKNTWNEGIFRNNEIREELVENLEEDDEMEDLDTEIYTSDEEEELGEDDSDENIEKALDTQEDVLEVDETKIPDSVKLAEYESEYSEEVQSQGEVLSTTNAADQLAATKQNQEIKHEAATEVASDSADQGEVASTTNAADQLAATPQNQEIENEAATEVASDSADQLAILQIDDDISSACALTNLESSSDVNSLSEGVQSSPKLELHKFLAYHVMEISSLFAALLTVAAAFIYKFKRNPSLVNVVPADTLLSKQQTGYEFSQREIDDIGESTCSSEMSHFKKSASYSNKEARGVQSSERKTRKCSSSKRESLASSGSEYSASYGSFTTLERIPIKHATGDEEIVTPVRRSSRIRNHQVTSP